VPGMLVGTNTAVVLGEVDNEGFGVHTVVR